MNKKKKRTKFRHKIVFFILRPFFWLMLRIKYGFHYKKYRLPKGPALILFNHATDLDPVMVGLSLPGPIYFIATDDIFSIKRITPLIRYLVAPISKSKATTDINTIRECLRTVKEGGRVSVAPEGNRTFTGELCYVNPAIVKLVRLLGVPLVLYNITGGFGVHPRFSPYLRRGRITGAVRKVIMPDAYSRYTDDKLYESILKYLDVNEMASGRIYKSKKRAEFMESLFYVCPICEKLCTIHTHGNYIYCDNCGMIAEYGEDRHFTSHNSHFKFSTVLDWYNYQIDFILSYDIPSFGTIFTDKDVTLRQVIRNKRKVDILTGTLSMDKDKLSIENVDEKRVFLLKEMFSIALLGQNKINFYIGDDVFQLKSGNYFNAIKYMHLYHIIRMERQGDKDGFLGI